MGGETVFRLAKGLEYLGQPVCKCFLVLDALINSWCAISLSICMFAILFKESNAKDVVFDALSLAFLLNVDDIASDFGFLGQVWDPAKVGRPYDVCLGRRFRRRGRRR